MIERNTLGALLRQKRMRAKLSRARLARLAGISEATIKFIETARTQHRHSTLLRLLSVSALALRPAELGLDIVVARTPLRAVTAPFLSAILFHRIHKLRHRRRTPKRD